MTAILPMLETMGLADTDNASTTIWLDLLARYEEGINKERRMAIYVGEARRVDEATGEVSHSQDAADDAALRDAIAALEAWRAHAAVAREMIAWLDGALTTIEAIPTEDFAGWSRAGDWWTRLCRGARARPLPPTAPWRDWRWDDTLSTHEGEGYRSHLLVCRQRLRLLAPPGKAAIREEYGIVTDSDILWRIFPVAERDALMTRADALGVCTWYSTMGPGSRRKAKGAA